MLYPLSYTSLWRLSGCWMPPPAINAPPITPSQSLCCFARVIHAHIERHGKAVELPGGDDPPSAEYESAVLPLNYGSVIRFE